MIKFLSKLKESLSLSLFFNFNNVALLNCWIELSCQKVKHRNLGDELNYYLLATLTGKRIYNVLNTFHHINKFFINYLCVGSIIEDFVTPRSIIWGAGCIEGQSRPLRNKPAKVLAVRGKLTRQYLLDNGIDCPEVFGDPALLAPLVYPNPKVNPSGIGIIPHVSEIGHHSVQSLIEQGVKLIRLDQYENWTDVIDKICSCEMILSSSLHGLILSDVYSIPNIWITISNKLIGGTFKFRDYFSSVGRVEDVPLTLSSTLDVHLLQQEVEKYTPISFNPLPLLSSSPWKLNVDYKQLKNVKSYAQYNNPGL